MISPVARFVAMAVWHWLRSPALSGGWQEVGRGPAHRTDTRLDVGIRHRQSLPAAARKALDFESDGTWDKQKWEQAGRELGPAARIGDQVQVTKLEHRQERHRAGAQQWPKAGKSWKDHVSVGLGGAMQPISGKPSQATNAPGGAAIVVHFRDGIGELTSADVKKVLAPVLDFDKQSATEQTIDTLTPEVKAAVLEKKAIEGMDRDEVLLAMGRPNRKTRESKDGVDFEDWIYGEPPGRVTFVTFAGAKVAKIKETYAGLGRVHRRFENPVERAVVAAESGGRLTRQIVCPACYDNPMMRPVTGSMSTS